MTPASRVLLLALCSRAALLLGLLAADAAFPDLDTSTRLAAALPCASAGAAAAPPPPAAPPIPLLVWDTAYFSRIAKCGYETDKINAFFPLLPAVMRAAAAVTGGVPCPAQPQLPLPVARLPPPVARSSARLPPPQTRPAPAPLPSSARRCAGPADAAARGSTRGGRTGGQRGGVCGRRAVPAPPHLAHPGH